MKILFVTLFCAAIVLSKIASAGQILDVSVTPRAKSNEFCCLDISLQYKGDHPLTMYAYELPWRNVASLYLYVVKNDGKRTNIPEMVPFDDPTFEKVTILPNQTLSGSIDISDRFEGLRDTIKKYGVTIFWSYQLRFEDPDHPITVAGAVVIPKANAH